jgi:two-component system NarL family sensor kinase
MKRGTMFQNPNPLARVLISLVKSHDEQMARAARRLHDDVAQVLSAVGLRLGLLRMDMEESAGELVEQLNESQKLLEKAVDSIRSLSYDLNPAIVERAGLAAALDRLTTRHRQTFPGAIQLSYDSSVKLPPERARSVYLILEAAVDNAVSHSQAERIEVSAINRAGAPRFQVSDDGRGFDCQAQWQNPSSIGLLLMRYYADQNDIHLDIYSQPGKGTIVTVSVLPPMS